MPHQDSTEANHETTEEHPGAHRRSSTLDQRGQWADLSEWHAPIVPSPDARVAH
jgi:hypothetical protein